MTITITDEQARVIQHALEMFSRVGCGQLWSVAEMLARYGAKGRGGKPIGDYWHLREQHFDPLASTLWQMPPGAAMAIGNKTAVPDACRTAYDVEQAIRHALGDLREPVKFSKEPLPAVTT